MKKIQYNSPVILSFFLVSLAALALRYLTAGYTTTKFFSVYRSSLADPFAYIRFVGHVFGHTDWNHFFNNMLLLLVVGPPLEELYGSRTLALGILFTAAVSGILQVLLFPESMLLGASGIVFMLIMLSSMSGAQEGKLPATLILAAAMYIGQEICSIFFVGDNVANLMHIVGGICGISMGFFVKNTKRNAAGHIKSETNIFRE